jgi:hypothetical protein
MRSPDQYPFPPFNAPTKGQYDFLDRNRLPHDHTTDLCDATRTIDAYVRSRRVLEPTARQIELLKRHKQWREGMTRGDAYDAIRLFFAGCR